MNKTGSVCLVLFVLITENCLVHTILRGDSRNYMPFILVPSSAKVIATQILTIAKLKGRKDFILRVCVCDINRPSKELPVQSY